MSLSYGFYNSRNHDRLYNAEDISRIFDGIINDGVYDSIGEAFTVSATSGMVVGVGTGRAWFNHTWTYNDSLLYLEIDESEVILDRIDAIVLEVNADTGVRANDIKVVKGTAASNPSRPTLTNTATVHQYPLAYISVPRNTSEVIQDNITNMVGTDSCPFVNGIISTISTNTLIAQWEAQFYTWFDEMKGQLSEDAAGHLQNEIDNLIKVITNISITSSMCVPDTTYNGYPYKIDIPVYGALDTHVPKVYFDSRPANVYFKEIAEATTGYVTLYLTNNTFENTISIPVIELNMGGSE